MLHYLPWNSTLHTVTYEHWTEACQFPRPIALLPQYLHGGPVEQNTFSTGTHQITSGAGRRNRCTGQGGKNLSPHQNLGHLYCQANVTGRMCFVSEMLLLLCELTTLSQRKKVGSKNAGRSHISFQADSSIWIEENFRQREVNIHVVISKQVTSSSSYPSLLS